jgi:ketosteroid isomerase-like protein
MFLSLLSLALSGAAGSATADAAVEIKALVIAFNAAYERNELDTYFSYYAEDCSQWFESGRVSLADYKKDWYQLIGNGGGVEKNALSDIQVQVGPSGDVAVATYALEVVTRSANGKKTKERAWETDVWFRRDGKWNIAHLHYNSKEVP